MMIITMMLNTWWRWSWWRKWWSWRSWSRLACSLRCRLSLLPQITDTRPPHWTWPDFLHFYTFTFCDKFQTSWSTRNYIFWSYFHRPSTQNMTMLHIYTYNWLSIYARPSAVHINKTPPLDKNVIFWNVLFCYVLELHSWRNLARDQLERKQFARNFANLRFHETLPCQWWGFHISHKIAGQSTFTKSPNLGGKNSGSKPHDTRHKSNTEEG